MALHFYYSKGGPFARRCLLTLAANGLNYTAHPLDIGKQEHRTAAMLAINPRGALPLLQDGDILVRESQAVMFYLDRAYPDPPLYGRTPQEAAAVMQEIAEQASYLEGPLKAILGPLLFGQRVEKLEEAVSAAATSLRGEFDKLEARLQKQANLTGELLSAADINSYPFFPALERALQQPQVSNLSLGLMPFSKCYPAVGRWMAAMESIGGAD